MRDSFFRKNTGKAMIVIMVALALGDNAVICIVPAFFEKLLDNEFKSCIILLALTGIV